MKGKKIAEFQAWYVDIGDTYSIWDAADSMYTGRAQARRKAAEYMPPRPAIRRVTVQIYEHKRAK